MIAILPALNGGGHSVLQETGLGLLKAVIVLSATVLLGTRVIPWLMDRITRVGSREIFVLTVVATAFAIAAVTEYVGLSAAMGAFVAGLMLSQSDFGHRALAEITPMKDIFAALFFASLGMLTDPMFVVENYVPVLAIVGSVLVLKFVITAGLVRGFGYLPGTALTSGFGMVQIGEFSFLLAAAAFALGVVDQSFHSLVVVSAVITMAIAQLSLPEAPGRWNFWAGASGPFNLTVWETLTRRCVFLTWAATSSFAGWAGLARWWPRCCRSTESHSSPLTSTRMSWNTGSR